MKQPYSILLVILLSTVTLTVPANPAQAAVSIRKDAKMLRESAYVLRRVDMTFAEQFSAYAESEVRQSAYDDKFTAIDEKEIHLVREASERILPENKTLSRKLADYADRLERRFNEQQEAAQEAAS